MFRITKKCNLYKVNRKTVLNPRILIIFYIYLTFCAPGILAAQQDTSATIRRDSVFVSYTDFKLSKDSLDAEVSCSAKDTLWYEISKKRIHLINKARMKYKTIDLKADYIVFDWNSNLLHATGRPDSLGNLTGFPDFADGEQKFQSKELKYNFKSKKGIVYDVTSKENDLFVHGSVAKFVASQDTLHKENYVYSHNALITTCDRPDPHYGIRSSKQKVVTDKVAVVGPSYLEINHVPTPLVLPFGFFPLAKGQRAGLILPRDYETSETWGLGFRDIGYYMPLGQNLDLKLTADIYFRGTWGIRANTRYKKRYKYNGNFDLAFADRRREETGTSKILSEKSFKILWNHNQDPKAHPSIQLGGNVNIETNNFQRTNYNDSRSVLNNTLSSNINFTKRFLGTSQVLTASLSHSQNTNTRDVIINFPTIGYQTGSVYPLKRKGTVIGPEKWYEKIFFTYDAQAKNEIRAKDTTLFTSQTLDESKYGIRQSLNTSYNTRILKYFNVAPSLRYEETWNFHKVIKNFDKTTIIDTIPVKNSNGEVVDYTYKTTYGKATTQRVNGFSPFRTFSASLSANTQIFGTMQFKKGFIRGIRHVMKPNVSLNYTPDYASIDRYFGTIETDSRPEFNKNQRYSVFETGIFGSPPDSKQSLNIAYGINNIFEGKYYNKRDSTNKKFKIFDNINIGGSYNLAADSLNWSRLSFSGTARFLKGITVLSVNGSFDPYDVDSKGKTINTFYYKSKGKLLRFVSTNFNFNSSITLKQLWEWKTDKNKQQSSTSQVSVPQELFQNIFLRHTFNVGIYPVAGGDTIAVTNHNLDLNGNIPITKNWRIDVGSIGYDFKAKRVTYPDLGFYRDLHCWEMGMNWQPERGTYSFYLRVKPSSLDFLNVPYRKSNQDTFF